MQKTKRAGERELHRPTDKRLWRAQIMIEVTTVEARTPAGNVRIRGVVAGQNLPRRTARRRAGNTDARKAAAVPTVRPVKASSTGLLYAGYRAVSTSEINVVRVLRPADAPAREEWASGVENGYLVRVGLDGQGAVVADMCECAAGGHGVRCKHARLVEGVALWVAAVRTHSKAVLDSCVLVAAKCEPKDDYLSPDFDMEILIVAPRPGGPEYMFARKPGDTGPGFECWDGTPMSGYRQIVLSRDSAPETTTTTTEGEAK